MCVGDAQAPGGSRVLQPRGEGATPAACLPEILAKLGQAARYTEQPLLRTKGSQPSSDRDYFPEMFKEEAPTTIILLTS